MEDVSTYPALFVELARRGWTLAEDMAPMRVLNRGFGGSHIAHVNHYRNNFV